MITRELGTIVLILWLLATGLGIGMTIERETQFMENYIESRENPQE